MIVPIDKEQGEVPDTPQKTKEIREIMNIFSDVKMLKKSNRRLNNRKAPNISIR